MNKKTKFPLIGKEVRVAQSNRYGKGYAYNELCKIVGASSTCVNIEVKHSYGTTKVERFLIRNGRRFGDGGAWVNDFFLKDEADIQLIKDEHRKLMPEAWCPRRTREWHLKPRNAEYCVSCAEDIARLQRFAAHSVEQREIDARVDELCKLHPVAAEAVREAFRLGLRANR